MEQQAPFISLWTTEMRGAKRYVSPHKIWTYIRSKDMSEEQKEEVIARTVRCQLRQEYNIGESYFNGSNWLAIERV